jgi:hypothetical protein
MPHGAYPAAEPLEYLTGNIYSLLEIVLKFIAICFPDLSW